MARMEIIDMTNKDTTPGVDECTIEIGVKFTKNKQYIGHFLTVPEDIYKKYDREEWDELVSDEISPFLRCALVVIARTFEEKGFINLQNFIKQLGVEATKEIL